MKRQLRPYQKNAITSIIDGFKQSPKQICVLPTGGGKTVIFSNVIDNLKTKTLIVAHTNELLDQIQETIRSECPHLCCEKLGRYRNRKNVDVLICSISRTFYSATMNYLKEQGFDLLIIDECHRSCAKSYRKLIDEIEIKKLLGVTATPFRTDQQSVYELFGFSSFSMNLIDMIEEGFLADFKGFRVKTSVSIEKTRKARGDFIANKLEPVINVKNRNELIVQQYQKLSNNEKAVAFCVSVKHAQDLRDEFVLNGIPCETIYGTMIKSKRKQILSDFKSGKLRVITSCNILTEGFDEPSITTLMMCRPTMSKTLYTQMIGRGSRLFPGKDFCKVIEFSDNYFDVCGMEDLLETPIRTCRIKEGEMLSSYRKRANKELLESTSEVTILPHEIYIKNKEKLATDWQLQQLMIRRIEYKKPLLEKTANYLLSRS